MSTNNIISNYLMLASPSIVRSRCSGSSNVNERLGCGPNSGHTRPTSWHWQAQVLSTVILLALVASPATVSAMPLPVGSSLRISLSRIYPRGQDSSSQDSNNNGSINMNVWLPILLVTIMFVIFSFVACARRFSAVNAAAAAATANQATSAGANAMRPRRRPRRTPSQVSTKSLPPYMKEPGDHELVLFRGPLETEDDHMSPRAIPTLAEEDEEHSEMRNTAFDIPLDRMVSVDTMADSSTTNLIRRVSESVTRPPELHHATMPHDHRRSVDAHSLGSAGSEAELLPAHQRGISVDSRAETRGQAPAYTESTSAMTTVQLNGPESNTVSPNVIVPPSSAAGSGRSRFNLLKHNPFSSHNNNNASPAPSNVGQSPPSTRPETPAQQIQSGSALTRMSSHESHGSRDSRAPSRNHNLSRSHSRSNSNLFRAFHSHSHAGSSTISLDSISAPLTHTLTRAEFHAPKGGLLTAEQVKLITSREALEKFGMPYGPDAVAFSLSRERLAGMGPPPDFETVTGEHQGDGASNGATEEAVRQSDTPDLGAVPQHSTSLLHASQPSPHPQDVRAESRASTDITYATAVESDAEGYDSHAQAVQVYTTADDEGIDGPDGPRTAHLATPSTARPLGPSRDHGSVARHH